MEQLFNELSSHIMSALDAEEHLSLSCRGERSLFTRINGAKIRQTGRVDQSALGFDYIHNGRRAQSSLSLTGDLSRDRQSAMQELERLRNEVQGLPEDPFIVLPSGDQSSRSVHPGNSLDHDNTLQALLPAMQDVDLSGIWASGEVYAGSVNSAGAHHWFETSTFSLDYSLVTPQERMVKATFAGSDWDQQRYEQSMAESKDRLELMARDPIKIEPGEYRTYIASAGVADLLGMFSWHGLSEAAIQQGESAFGRMRNEQTRLSPRFSLFEDFSTGYVPRFNNSGEVAPESMALIEKGELKNTLISSRTAKEYDLISNFADQEEDIRSAHMPGGSLPEEEVLAALGTGVYLSNLHYLNWSDVPGGRITGMTRYACFWVEQGKIVAPIENMRFDDSFYRYFGDNLEAVTSAVLVNPDVGTYEGRELAVTRCPGILLSAFALTL